MNGKTKAYIPSLVALGLLKKGIYCNLKLRLCICVTAHRLDYQSDFFKKLKAHLFFQLFCPEGSYNTDLNFHLQRY